MEIACRKCKRETQLTPGRIKSYGRVCNRCMNVERDADVARYLARKLADKSRRAGIPRPYPGVQFVRQVLNQCTPATDDNNNLRHMCVVLKDPSAGFTLENAQLVTSSESYALSRARNSVAVANLMMGESENLSVMDHKTTQE